jgi:hypothetical protein
MKRTEKKAPTENDRAPMCNICQPPRRHWGREGHRFEKAPKAKK